MRRVRLAVSLTILCAVNTWAQQTAAPQTARQALLEMFFSKTPGTFAKHLPLATRNALDKSGAMATLQQYSVMASQLETQGQNLRTFETGSVLLVGENPKSGGKVEITVENDALRGDQDDIELSFQVYKNGKTERTPFMPQMTFSMKQEADIWKLNEISVTIHVPLADPDFLKAMTDKMTDNMTGNMRPSAVGRTSYGAQVEGSAQPAGSDAIVLAAMRSILAAEMTYASSYPTVGYTCSLSSLDGFGGGEPNERQAMLINSGLASGKKYGFVFTLSECGAAPAASFHLTAVPNGASYGRKAFCADQTGVIRSSIDGNPATCLTSGAPVQ